MKANPRVSATIGTLASKRPLLTIKSDLFIGAIFSLRLDVDLSFAKCLKIILKANTTASIPIKKRKIILPNSRESGKNIRHADSKLFHLKNKLRNMLRQESILIDHQTVLDSTGLDFQIVNLFSLMKIKKSKKINRVKIFR